ncbi:hypothetical protein [Geomicrobium sp. JCM 19037]|uniref:hypothetical protein n=1 Tax=Geomicrobium sp. JCM 19037 TaxID=1460634 RepID=UPI001EE65D34|nr:hypothetical protein [Geomicrobium sp. JCM 19037]
MFSFPKPSYEQFFHTYPIQTFAVSRDEKKLMYSTNVSGSYEVWRMNLSNCFSQPITSIGQSNFGMTFSKDGQSLITSFDNDGDENAQIYALPESVENSFLFLLVKRPVYDWGINRRRQHLILYNDERQFNVSKHLFI